MGAGGREIKTPFGVFYGTNITPDAATGIGAWSDAEIVGAIRAGDARGKGVEAPVMPYYLYAGMTDGDVADLVAYLRTLAPVSNTGLIPRSGTQPATTRASSATLIVASSFARLYA